ncbi:MAG: hydrogenase [Bacteroidetes bacterium]|nr:hydrogenase [Bacteroidota bacterium]
MATQSEKILFLGVLLFFLGLVVGLFIPMMANPRMGLTTHLEGVINGMFLMILSLFWSRVNLSDRALSIVFGLAVYGAFANFSAVLMAALTGAGKMMPIAGGQQGSAILEGLISFLLISLALAMLAMSGMLLYGLYKPRRAAVRG